MTDTAAADLTAARDRLMAVDATGPRLDAQGLREALTGLHEFWLAAHAPDWGVTAGGRYAIVAVGGLARRELMPHSDLDLILLHDDPDRRQVASTADRIWYPLWDANIALDHSVRTVEQALRVAEDDVTAALGLLEARHLAGNPALTSALTRQIRSQWRSAVPGRLEQVVGHAKARWERVGEIASRAEPDVKNGKGGLRDVQLLRALAIAQVTNGMPGPRPDSPGAGFADAHRILLDVRTELHRAAGRRREQLRAQDADEIAAALRLGDRFDLARALSDAARTIAYSVDVGVRTARNTVASRSAPGAVRPTRRRPLGEGVVEHDGEVVLARGARSQRDPGLIMRMAAAAAVSGLPMSAATLNRLADTAPEIKGPWPREVLDDLLVLLGAGRSAIAVIEALDRTGLWGRLLPEWGAVRDLPPRDVVHTWTVDRHLVETVVRASSMTTRVARPDLLLLAALLHDIGKGRGVDHSVLGAELAAAIGTRLGLVEADVRVLSALVRHHLLLARTATRRDLDDPATVDSVVVAVDGSAETLALLHALAEADARATGPGVWGEWKARLTAELVRRCAMVLRGEHLPEPGPMDAGHRALAESGTVSVMLRPSGGLHSYLVTIVAPAEPGLLSKAAGVLAVHGLNVHSAHLGAHADAVVDTFVVSTRFGSPPDAGLLRQVLVRALSGDVDLAGLLAAKEREVAPAPRPANVAGVAAAPRVLWFDTRSADQAIVEIRATNALGLLSRVAAALEESGAEIRWAKVATMGSSVVDSFCVSSDDVRDAAVRSAIEQRLLRILA